MCIIKLYWSNYYHVYVRIRTLSLRSCRIFISASRSHTGIRNSAVASIALRKRVLRGDPIERKSRLNLARLIAPRQIRTRRRRRRDA